MFNVFKVQHQALRAALPKTLCYASFAPVCCWPRVMARSSWNQILNSSCSILITISSKRKCIWWVVTWGRTADAVFKPGFLGQIFLRLLQWPNFVSIAKQQWLALWWGAGEAGHHAQLSSVILCSFAQVRNAWERGKKSVLKSEYWKTKKVPYSPFNFKTEDILSYMG